MVILLLRDVIQAYEQLIAHVSECDGSLDGQSLGVAAALGILSLVVAIKPLQEEEKEEGADDGSSVVVTGTMDLTGKVYPVSGLAGKVQVSPKARQHSKELILALSHKGAAVVLIVMIEGQLGVWGQNILGSCFFLEDLRS